MSVDIQLLIERHIPKSEIEAIIYSLGFEKREDKDGYFWMGDKFKSIRGCWFGFGYDDSVFVENEEKHYKTMCVTTTYAGRSHNDFQKQIDTIKLFEDSFGGSVYTDGEYGYSENDIPKLSESDIACGFAYSNFKSNLYMSKQLIEEVDTEKVKSALRKGFPLTDESLLRNNTLIPFFVAIMETFLKTFIHSYIITNEEAQNQIFKKKEKLSYGDVKKLLSREITIADIEIDEYSFQNFQSANKAFIKFLRIDLFEDILSEKISVEGKERKLVSVLSELIEKRHKIIHEAELTYLLDKERMENYYSALCLFGDTFIKVLKEKRNLRINLEKELYS